MSQLETSLLFEWGFISITGRQHQSTLKWLPLVDTKYYNYLKYSKTPETMKTTYTSNERCRYNRKDQCQTFDKFQKGL